MRSQPTNAPPVPPIAIAELFDAFPDLILHSAEDGTRLGVYGNKALLAVPAEDLIGKRGSLLDSEAQERIQALRQKVIARRISQTYEYELTVNGSVRAFEARIIPYRERETLAMIRDITPQKALESALRLNESKYRTMLEVHPDLIIFTDIDGIYQGFEGNLQMLIAPPEDMLGKPMQQFFPNDPPEQFLGPIRQAVSTGAIQVRNYEISINNTLRHYESRIVPMWGTQVMLVVRDVTEVKLAEKTLKENQERYQLLFNTVADPILLIDADQMAYFDVNDAALRAYGYTREEFLQIGIGDLSGEPEHAKTTIRLAATEGPQQLPLRWHCRKDGASFPVEIEMAAFDWQGRRIVTIVARDITARKANEDAMQNLAAELEDRVQERTLELAQANMQLQELDDMKSEFLASISHELRTPITNLRLYHRLIKENPDKQNRYLEVLERETERLQYIVEELLSFSELAHAREAPALLAVNVNQFLEQRQLAYYPYLQQQTIRFVPAPYEGFPVVRVNPAALWQAINVLLINACSYTPPGGTITVETGVVTDSDGCWVTIAVSDTGAGMSEEDMAHAFDRFYRGKAAQQTNRPGTGLGLPIARTIIERSGGRIEVSSEGPGTGSRFSIYLPCE